MQQLGYDSFKKNFGISVISCAFFSLFKERNKT